ncbi:MAG: hypothetical protein Q9157_000783 [Trypethelium eluteriae]
MSSLLVGKAAAITGGMTGIGRAIALDFLRHGASVMVNFMDDDPSQQHFKSLQREASSIQGSRLQGLVGDIKQRETGQEIVEASVNQFGGLDVFVANAGISQFRDFLTIDKSTLDSHIQTNIQGTFWTTQAAANQMIRQGHGGSIIGISSISAHLGGAQQVHYTPTKAAVLSMMQSSAGPAVFLASDLSKPPGFESGHDHQQYIGSSEPPPETECITSQADHNYAQTLNEVPSTLLPLIDLESTKFPSELPFYGTSPESSWSAGLGFTAEAAPLGWLNLLATDAVDAQLEILQKIPATLDVAPSQPVNNFNDSGAALSACSTTTEAETYVSDEEVPLSRHELSLLQHFVNHLSSWIDLTDPDQSFSIVVPSMALRNKGLMKAVLALSARHLSLQPALTSASESTSSDRTLSVRYYSEALQYLQQAMQDKLDFWELVNRAFFLLGQCVNYISDKETEAGRLDMQGRIDKGQSLWNSLEEWVAYFRHHDRRLPVLSPEHSSFKSIWINPPAASAAVQIYFFAKLLLLDMMPATGGLRELTSRKVEVQKCVSSICGIAQCTSKGAAMITSTYCLYAAATHVDTTQQKEEIAALLQAHRETTGWPNNIPSNDDLM